MLIFMILFSAQTALAEELTIAKRNDIVRLMEVTGSLTLAQQFATASSQAIFRVLKSARPDIPDRALVVMERELLSLFSEKTAAPGGLIDLIVPIYSKHFTHQDIRELLSFYETPIGKKAILVLPQAVKEGMAAGQLWGKSLGPEIEQRVTAALTREGVLPPRKEHQQTAQ